MPSKGETMESGEAMAVPALLSRRCGDWQPRHAELRPCGHGAGLRDAAYVQVQEWLPTLLALMVPRRRQQRAREAVTLHARRRCHLFCRLHIRSFRSRFIALGIRRRRRLANHLQRRPSLVGDRRSGHIPWFVKIRNEASYVNILVVGGWLRKVRWQGHVSGRIIRRARCTASCDRFVSVVTMSLRRARRRVSRDDLGRLFRARFGAGREEGGCCEWTRPTDTYKRVGAEGTQRETLDERGGGAVSGSLWGHHVARSPAGLCRVGARAGCRREVGVALLRAEPSPPASTTEVHYAVF